jgi:hypothetical protein
MKWPTGTPPNIRSQLQALADAHQLSGVAPQILSAICKYTSNWGLTGLGINSTGFGGYFGQHVGWSYPGRPQGFTAAQLTTPNTFPTQAKVAAATLAGYGWSLAASLAIYVSGSPVNVTSGFVQYVLASTGANGAGPVTSLPTTKETVMISVLAVGDQLHVWVTTPQTTTVRHWWQATTGPDAGKWQGPETLPS